MLCMISARQPSIIAETSTLPYGPQSSPMDLGANFGFIGLYDGLTGPRRFWEVVFEIVQAPDEMACQGECCSYYSTAFGRFNTLRMAAFDGQAATEAMSVLQGSSHYKRLKSILEAEFGCCIYHGKVGVGFFPRLTLVEML